MSISTKQKQANKIAATRTSVKNASCMSAFLVASLWLDIPVEVRVDVEALQLRQRLTGNQQNMIQPEQGLLSRFSNGVEQWFLAFRNRRINQRSRSASFSSIKKIGRPFLEAVDISPRVFEQKRVTLSAKTRAFHEQSGIPYISLDQLTKIIKAFDKKPNIVFATLMGISNETFAATDDWEKNCKTDVELGNYRKLEIIEAWVKQSYIDGTVQKDEWLSLLDDAKRRMDKSSHPPVVSVSAPSDELWKRVGNSEPAVDVN